MAFSHHISPTIPVVDIERARKFYEDKLGLQPLAASRSAVIYDCGEGTTLFLYKGRPSNAEHVIAAFEVENIRERVKQLETVGITFEEHNMPGIDKLVDVATVGPDEAAWFKDSEGNILALLQLGMMLELAEHIV